MAYKSHEYYFKILEINSQSTKIEIKKAYKNLLKIWHPDKFPNDEQQNLEATEKSKEINEAYEFLKNYESATNKQDNYPPNYTNGNRKGKKEIIRTAVRSSNIHSIGYDFIEMILQIEFLNGNIYEYYDIEEIVYLELIKSESKGKFLHRNIYYKYRYQTVN